MKTELTNDFPVVPVVVPGLFQNAKRCVSFAEPLNLELVVVTLENAHNLLPRELAGLQEQSPRLFTLACKVCAVFEKRSDRGRVFRAADAGYQSVTVGTLSLDIHTRS